MTDSQANRPDPSDAGGVASPGQPAVPPQPGRASGTAGTGSTGTESTRGAADTSPDGLPRPAGPGRDAGGQPSAAAAGDGPAGALTGALAHAAWTAALAAALGMIAIGILLLAWPSATLTVVAILIGAALLVAGVLKLVEGIVASRESSGMRAADIVIGILAIVAGLYCLKHHALTVLLVALVVGALWIIHGVGDLVIAASAGPVPDRGLRAVMGLFSLAAGLVILFWPGISLILLLTILGAWLLLYGVVLAVLALRLRQETRQQSRRAPRPAHA